MLNKIKNINLYNALCNTIIIILLIIFYYKLNIEFFVPISGDELNSILVYSSNVKTIFLKNFPGNVTFFHLIGYLKAQFFGFDLTSFRAITFIFLAMHFWVLKKLNFLETKNIIFFILLLITNLSLYAGLYVGYIFSSFIFVLIFYYLQTNYKERNNKIIFLLLFIQFYNHLVNLYLVFPIIFSLFIVSNKKKFIKQFFIFFFLPTVIFYFISIILTGLSEQKIINTSPQSAFFYFIENISIIIVDGFNRIFFYEAYSKSPQLNITVLFVEFFSFDKIILLFFLISIIISIYNFKTKKINIVFSYIILLHILTIFIINKQPAPRIFTGYYCFYIFLFFQYLKNYLFVSRLLNFRTLYLLFFIILGILFYNFNYLNNIKSSIYNVDMNFKENKISLKLLENDCSLVNNHFNEIQKRNFYFNFLNLCNKKFNLNNFLIYYRS